MSSNDQRQTPPRDLAFLPKNQLLTHEDVGRALRRMAHEIVERNHSVENISIIGLQTGGEPFATKLAELLSEISGTTVPRGLLDVSFYRDDLSRNPIPKSTRQRLITI